MKDRGRLYSLDALRGLAALSIIFWHWQHMFFDPRLATTVFERSAQPYYQAFYYLYNYGDRAVTVFFVLSGFVFYWLYSEALRVRLVQPWNFITLRFSRLFPLHWLTFALVVGLQLIYSRRAHTFFVYPRHDLFLAFQTLLGVTSWVPHNVYGFNGPFWSVSIELLLYLIFLLVCRYISSSVWPTLGLVFLGILLRHAHEGLSHGLMGFFTGGLAFHVFCWIRARGHALAWLMATGVATLTGWATLEWLAHILKMDTYPAEPVFAGIIVFIALAERRLPSIRTGLSGLGDISYSVYLLHFPLQIVFVLGNNALGGKSEIFYQGWTLLLFFCVLIPLGFLSYRTFELPLLQYLRSRTNRTKGSASSFVEVTAEATSEQ